MNFIATKDTHSDTSVDAAAPTANERLFPTLAARGVIRGHVVLAIKVLREHLAEAWTLSSLATEVHLSRSQLVRAFEAPRASVRWPTCATCGSRGWPVCWPRPTCRSPRRLEWSARRSPTTRAGASMGNTASRLPSPDGVNLRLLSTETRVGTDKTLRQGRRAVTCNTSS